MKQNLSNIGIKVPDMEWKMTGWNARPPASNETPADTGLRADLLNE